MKVRKAVIAAAGMGTRFLPQTKAMPKEMLPIIDKPVIQIVVEGLIKAGVEDIIIVTGPTKRAIEDHFDRSLELEDQLIQKGKKELADNLVSIAEMANFIYVRQKGEPRGNARPILNASHLIGDEPFFFCFADDFFTGDLSTAEQLLAAFNESNKSAVALRKVEKSETKNYGIADVISSKGRISELRNIIEKPSSSEAPSDLAVGSGYLLKPSIIPILETLKPSKRGEIEISDALSILAENEGLIGVEIDGDYHDTGNPEIYLKTQIKLALKDPRYSKELRAYIKTLL